MMRVSTGYVLVAVLFTGACGSSTATEAEARAALESVEEGWVEILLEYRSDDSDVAVGDEHPATCSPGEGTIVIEGVSTADVTATLVLDDCEPGTLGGDHPRWTGSLTATIPRASPFSYVAHGDVTIRDGDVEFGVTSIAFLINAEDSGFYCWEVTAIVDAGEVELAFPPAGLAQCQ